MLDDPLKQLSVRQCLALHASSIWQLQVVHQLGGVGDDAKVFQVEDIFNSGTERGGQRTCRQNLQHVLQVFDKLLRPLHRLDLTVADVGDALAFNLLTQSHLLFDQQLAEVEQGLVVIVHQTSE